MNYSTRNSSTATPSSDFTEVSSSQFSMMEGEYEKNINIQILDDNTPELDEAFTVELTGLTGSKSQLLILV